MKRCKTEIVQIYELTKRNMALYLKDKATVFFSLLAPLIVLLLYILFLRNIQASELASAMEGVSVKAIGGIVDSWLIAGVVSVCCLTVAVNSAIVIVNDRQNKVMDDFNSSPVRSYIITLSYFFAIFLITVFISMLVFLVGLIYLAASGSFYMSFIDVLAGIGILLLSCLSSTLIMMFIIRFFKSINAVSAFSGIFSAVVGFIIGAYMPISTFPKAIQYFTCLIPGSYSAGLFRNVFMNGAIQNLGDIPAEALQSITQTYSLKIDFFGVEIGMGWMALILAFSAILFLGINLLVHKLHKK